MGDIFSMIGQMGSAAISSSISGGFDLAKEKVKQKGETERNQQTQFSAMVQSANTQVGHMADSTSVLAEALTAKYGPRQIINETNTGPVSNSQMDGIPPNTLMMLGLAAAAVILVIILNNR